MRLVETCELILRDWYTSGSNFTYIRKESFIYFFFILNASSCAIVMPAGAAFFFGVPMPPLGLL